MNSADLRARAEAAVRMTRREVAALSERDVQRIMHELQVHQVELDMQNETLRCAQDELEASQQEYLELFECAPIALVLLDEKGQILRANTAALRVLTSPQAGLIGRYLRHFVVSADQVLLAQCVRTAGTAATCELRLSAAGEPRYVRAQVSRPQSRADVCLVTLIDISEDKRAQRALEHLERELELRTHALAERDRQLQAEREARAEAGQRRPVLEARLREADSERLGRHATGRALLIDDDGVVRRVFAKMLTALGFEVTQADSGERGLALLRTAEPVFSVLVLDTMTPGASEALVLKTLREFQAQLPVLLISGRGGESLTLIDRHLVSVQKPMTLKQLHGAMRALLGSHALGIEA